MELEWFQIRLVQKISATNVVLTHMGAENDVTCSFCRIERYTIQHIKKKKEKKKKMRTCMAYAQTF